jgi:hypothetical protein
MRSRAELVAENLFLRRQLALYMERRVKPRRADDATRLVLVGLSRVLEWRSLLTVVKPETLIRWHRKGFHVFLALEVPCAWPPAHSRRRAATHCENGGRESDLLPGAYFSPVFKPRGPSRYVFHCRSTR